MNALELADKLEQKALTADAMEYGFEVDFDEAATMLRQQQAEIEALKQIIDANNLSQNIGQFVKPANEPVAWMSNGKEFYVQKNYCPDFIPLYTHPVKELTNDEIWDFINALCLDMGDYWELTERNAIPMIRAILRKAQEK